MYDALALHYREYSDSKVAYLEAIDRLVIGRILPGTKSLLDVGAGDGVRAVRIAQARQIPTVVLAEPSEGMIAKCREQQVTDIWPVSAESLPDTGQRFEVITCLWNVLGHIPNHAARVRSLQSMRRLLAPEGVIFFDVNNRYNARSYGLLRTVGRMLYDFIRPSETNGDVSFDWHVDGKVIPSMGHLFTPGEVVRLIRESGLQMYHRYVVNYRTGRQGRFVFEGQLLYEVSRQGA